PPLSQTYLDLSRGVYRVAGVAPRPVPRVGRSTGRALAVPRCVPRATDGGGSLERADDGVQRGHDLAAVATADPLRRASGPHGFREAPEHLVVPVIETPRDNAPPRGDDAPPVARRAQPRGA